jgi:hypothetical protein
MQCCSSVIVPERWLLFPHRPSAAGIPTHLQPGGAPYSISNSGPLCTEVRKMPEKKDK